MPIYSVKGPDGRIYDVQGPEGASDEQVIAFLQQQLTEQPEQKPKEGLIAGLEKGAESTFSQLRSGLGSLIGSGDEAARAGLARGEDIGKRYADQVSLEKVKQAYADKGLLSAAGEAISQVPYAIAEQIPNLAANIGGARLGALAGSPFGPVGSVIGGGVGLIAPSLLQQLGGNVERQAAEGQKVDVGTAALGAAPQAALDVAGSFIPLGGRLVSKLTGLPVEALLGRTSAQATKLADERLLATLSKGTATGALAEIPTEVAQQMIERAQAGLSLSSPDALKEYGETAYQVGLLGPIGAVGRMSEVGGARQQVEQEQALDMRKKRMEAMDLEEKDRAAQEAAAAEALEQRKSPEFAQQAEAAYNALQQEYAQLKETAKGKVADGDLAGEEAKKAAQNALKTFRKSDKYKQVIADYEETAGVRGQLKKQREEDDKQKDIQDQLAAMQPKWALGKPDAQTTIPGLEPMETENVAPPTEEEATDYAQQVRGLDTYLEQLKERAKTTKDLDEKIALGEEFARVEKARDEAAENAKKSAKPTQKLSLLKRKMEIAEEEGEIAEQVKLAKQIKALGFSAEDISEAQIELDLGKPTKQQVSESTKDFNRRTYEPQGYSEDQQTSLLDQPYADYLSDQEKLDTMRQEGRTQAEIEAMEKLRIPQDVTEQLDMFGMPLSGGVVTGEKAAAPKSRAELVAEVQIGRITGNRQAVAETAEKIRNLDAETTGYKGSAKTTTAVATAQAAQEVQKESTEARMKELTALRDARDKLGDRYKAAKSADARAKLLPKLEAAEKAYTDAFYKYNAEPVTRRDLAADIKGAAKTTSPEAERRTMDTKGLTQPAVPFKEAAMPGQQPLRTRQQQAYADARAKAYADMVAIVSKYNQGKAKLVELETARGTLVENLIGDIEATRGAPVEQSEADQIRRDANTLLYDLVTRFGDTRNVTQKGTAKRPFFVPAQDNQGNFTSEAQYPTVESRPPGMQTFANPYAATLSIKEGLDDIRNKAVAQGTTAVDRTFTPEETTEEALREELDRAFAKGPDALSKEQRGLLEQVADNLKAINASADKRNLVAEYTYRASNGLQIDPSITKDVKDMLAAMEQGKRSETELVGGEVKRAVQADLDKTFGSEVLRGRVFDTPEAFEEYLASDALQQMRSTIGMTKPTLARLEARMAPFLKRAADLQGKVDGLQEQYDAILNKRKEQFAYLEKMTGEEAAQEKRELLRAEEMLKEAEANLKTVTDRLDEELRGLQIAYIEAEQAFSYSVQVSEDITKAIAANVTDFTKSETAALKDVLDAKEKLTTLFKQLASDDYPGGRNKGFAEVGPNTDWSTRFSSFKKRPEVLELQDKILAATRRWRANYNLNQSENRIVKFLDQDLNFQMQLQEEAAQMEGIAKNLSNAGNELELAKQKQDRSTKNKKALKEAKAEISTAQELVAGVKKRVEARAELIDQLERELGVERKTIRHRMTDDASELVIFNALTSTKELEDQLSAIRTQISEDTIVPSRALQAFIKRREKSLAIKEETQAQREERDKVQKRLENEQAGRLGAIPGEKISFEGRRKLIETLDATPENFLELDQIINDPESPAKDVAEATSAKKRLEAKADEIGKLLSNDPEVAKTITGLLDDRINKIEENIKKVTQRLQSPDKYDPILEKKRLSKADREAAVAGKKKLKDGRVKELNKYKRELAELKTKRDVKRGIERTEVGTQRYVEDIAAEGEARTLVPVDRKEGPAPEIGATRALRQAYQAAVADGATEVEYKGRTYNVNDVREYLAPRKIGPVVKKTVTAGNIRTGELGTADERLLSTRNKPTQAGAARAVTSLQAQRATDEMVKRISELEKLQAKVEDALEAAKDAGNKELVKRYSEGLPKIQKQLDVLEAKLPKALKDLTPSTSKPKKGMTEAQLEAERERVRESERNRAGEETDLEGAPVKFRTATAGGGSSVEDVKRLADRITADWTIKPTVKVVADESGLPDRIRKQAERDEKTGLIPGLYDPSTRTVYLIANNLQDANDVALTLAHEVAGHFGLQEILGGNYSKTMAELYNGNATVRKLADAKLSKEPNLDRNTAVEEVLADMAEKGVEPTPDTRSALRKIFDAIKAWFSSKGFKGISDNDVRKLVADARKYVIEGKRPDVVAGEYAPGEVLFRTEATYVNSEFAAAGAVTDKFVAKNRTFYDKAQATATGLTFETQFVDRFAGFERLAKLMKPLIGTQMLYYLRMYDQRMNFVSQAVGNGALQIVEKTRKDGSIERIIEAGGGASIKNVVQILKQANPLVGNGEAVNRLFTMYMSAIRAEDKGFAALHFGEDLTHAELKQAKASVDKNLEVKKIFDAARGEYNAYNKDMMNFLAQTGAISKETAAALTKNNDYIPWYRQRNGVAELVIGSEAPIKIGNIAEQPYLQELVGGDRPILDFMTSSVQNTNMLADMGLRNLSTKNAVIELANMDLAKIGKSKMAGPDVVRFKVDGEDRYAIINTDDAGVPADVLVKGMEGIPTQMPGMLRLLGMPATFLRKAVTASPLYAARQLFRDSLAAPILVGADFVPVIGALRQLGKSATRETLERRGITGGQIFTGSSEDISKILRDIADDKSGWVQAFGKLEAINMEADATTRRAQYNSYINQGLSEMEATLMSLESMNFNKRGASPSVHMANSLIPFFNAQIQGLNVLYKAMAGKLPFNEKLKIQKKILLRGGMIAAGTLAYASMMQEDEAYKNATPEQKYGNWFLRVPGVEEPVRIPIPFEIGYIFKALPEALYNSMVNEHGSEEAVKAFGSILKQVIPGGSSYGIPQAMRPAIEAGLGKSFYTGRDILSAQEKGLLPEDQFRENTSEVSKTIGRVAGVSPIILDSLVQGYTGAMGLAFVQAVGLGLTKSEGPEAAVKRLSNMPVVGSAFQPNDAGAIISRVYDRMNEFKKVENSVESLLNRGYKAEAMELLNTRGNEYAAAEIADYYTTTMRELTQYENAIKASSASSEQKRQQLDEIRKIKTQFATTVEQATDKTIPR